jgi:micrococcal nuclease
MLALVPAALFGPCGDEAGEPPAPEDPEQAAQLRGRVIDVSDGDTITVRLRDGSVETVRYIGVDTPESVDPDEPVQCYAHLASEFNRRLVVGREVRLRFDAERRDVYGRLLAYVYLGRRFVNAELVRRGFARTLRIAPNDSMAPLFARLAAAAARAGRGLWGLC